MKHTTEEIQLTTAHIYQDTGNIKEGTARIIQAIAELQARLPRDENSQSGMLQRYLDELTTYAESVIDDDGMNRIDDTDEESDPEEYIHLEPIEGTSPPTRTSTRTFSKGNYSSQRSPSREDRGMPPTTIDLKEPRNVPNMTVSKSSSVDAGFWKLSEVAGVPLEDFPDESLSKISISCKRLARKCYVPTALLNCYSTIEKAYYRLVDQDLYELQFARTSFHRLGYRAETIIFHVLTCVSDSSMNSGGIRASWQTKRQSEEAGIDRIKLELALLDPLVTLHEFWKHLPQALIPTKNIKAPTPSLFSLSSKVSFRRRMRVIHETIDSLPPLLMGVLVVVLSMFRLCLKRSNFTLEQLLTTEHVALKWLALSIFEDSDISHLTFLFDTLMHQYDYDFYCWRQDHRKMTARERNRASDRSLERIREGEREEERKRRRQRERKTEE